MAETGHAKNVKNWQTMIAACSGFGAKPEDFSSVADATRGIFLFAFRGLKRRGYIHLVADATCQSVGW